MKEAQEVFKAHGYRSLSNHGGVEIQLSEDCSMARLRYYEQEPTSWLEIQYTPEGEPYVEYNDDIMLLDQFIKV